MDIRMYQVPKGEHREGYFTFSVDGRPSHWYSSREEAVAIKVGSIMNPKPSAVQLPTVQSRAGVNGEKSKKKKVENKPSAPLTPAQSMKAFIDSQEKSYQKKMMASESSKRK